MWWPRRATNAIRKIKSHGEKPKDVQKSEIAVGSLLPKTEKTHIRKCQISGCEAQFETAQGKYFSKKRKLCPNSCVIYTVLFYWDFTSANKYYGKGATLRTKNMA